MKTSTDLRTESSVRCSQVHWTNEARAFIDEVFEALEAAESTRDELQGAQVLNQNAIRVKNQTILGLESRIRELEGHNRLLRQTQQANEPELRKAIESLYANGAALAETASARLLELAKKDELLQNSMLESQCPQCGEPHRLQRGLVGWTFVQHKPRSYVDRNCDGSGAYATSAIFVSKEISE